MPIPIQQLFIDSARGFHTWSSNEVYNGVDGHPGRYVPNVDDLVFSRVNGWFIVNSVDLSTGLSDLDPWSPPSQSGLSSQDILLGSGPGIVSESFRVFVNNSVLPHTLDFDSRLHSYGSNSTHCKVFLGSDTDEITGIVVSAYYNQSGGYVGENIPLELVQSPNGSNLAIYVPKKAAVNRTLHHNDLITVVHYGSNGKPISQQHALVRITDASRSSSAGAKYVESIEVVSAWLSETVANRLEFPSNITNHSAHVMGRVVWSDGTDEVLPIDGTRFSLHGINAYIPATVGESVDLVLAYKLGTNEYSSLPDTVNGILTKQYRLLTVEANDAYNVKIFGYPKWLDPVRGYTMVYWLYSLSRTAPVVVTPWVTYGDNNPAFDPVAYGIVQHLTLRLPLHAVDPDLYKEVTHVQNFTVTLITRGDLDTIPNWSLAYVANQSPQFGVNAYANLTEITTGSWSCDIRCGATTVESWLNRVYLSTKPLYHTATETNGPPTPTHFILKYKNFEQEKAITQWDNISTVPNDLAQGELLYIKFIRRSGLTDQHLAVAALPVHIL